MLNMNSALKLSLSTAAVFLISGCQSVSLPSLPNFSSQPIAGPPMPAAPLATYHVGDSYYYANGVRETVVSIEASTVTFINAYKRKLVYFKDFTIPTAYSENSVKEYSTESRVTGSLWPLRADKTTKFYTKGSSTTIATGNTRTYDQRWDCAVDGTERVRVLAGEFDTFRIKCRQLSASNGKWWRNRTWNFSPMLNAYVLRRDFHKTRGESARELTAVRPSLKNLPTNVRSGIIHAWQTALEYKKPGDLVSWTDPKTGASVQVEPITTYKDKNGQFCRTYKQYLTRKGETRIYSGVACRTGKLKWRTPRRRG